MDIFSWTLLIVAGGSFLALGYAAVKTKWIFGQPVENPKLVKIGGYVADGAMAFLTREYKVLIPFVLIVAAFLAIANQGTLKFQAIAFVVGATASALAGFIGKFTIFASLAEGYQATGQGYLLLLLVVGGINTAISRRDFAEGIGFALPIDLARNVVEQLRSRGEVRRGFIGMRHARSHRQPDQQQVLAFEYGELA